jgi:hypothetical protein
VIEIKPTTLKQANAYVEAAHRHHGRVVGHKWSLAAFKDGRLCGVAIVGRPTGRRLDDGNTLEVTRLCTDMGRGTPARPYMPPVPAGRGARATARSSPSRSRVSPGQA